MSDSESFLSRWSRRKREVSQEAEPANPPGGVGLRNRRDVL
jgi:hypothetical protein